MQKRGRISSIDKAQRPLAIPTMNGADKGLKMFTSGLLSVGMPLSGALSSDVGAPLQGRTRE
jgi:hypothetical protein